MNVYDFDNTIYEGDSTVNFFLYSLKKKPLTLITLPRTAVFGILFKLGLCTKTRFKEQFYRFLRRIDNVDALLEAFWKENELRIKPWYLECQRSDDIIISASPEFLLRPICKQLGVTMMASRVDSRTGIYTGVNCDGEEKIRRLYEAYPDAKVEKFYSDSHSDDPLAGIAEKAFWVRGSRITDWPNE